MRLLIIGMFTATLLAGAVLLGFGTPGASAGTTARHVARTETVKWKDLRNCEYKVTVVHVGSGGTKDKINTDTCHHKMWAVARCEDGNLIFGNVVTNPGRDTNTQGSCGNGNIGLAWWAIRVWQFVTRGHMSKVLHCLSATRCNN